MCWQRELILETEAHIGRGLRGRQPESAPQTARIGSLIMPSSRNSKPSGTTGELKRRLEAEDWVLLSVIAVGVLTSVLVPIFSLPVPSVIIAFLLGMAIAALVYRFLGGIDATDSFRVGALKLSGRHCQVGT